MSSRTPSSELHFFTQFNKPLLDEKHDENYSVCNVKNLKSLNYKKSVGMFFLPMMADSFCLATHVCPSLHLFTSIPILHHLAVKVK